MKKNFLMIAVMAILSIAFASAQPRAIGARLGWGADLNYQHNLGANVLDIDLGFPGFHGLQGTVTYNWVDPFGTAVPWNNKGSWDWYLGVGGKGGMYGLLNSNIDNSWFVGVAGRVGIEYNFWFPLNLSLDWTPCLGVAHSGENVGFNTDGLWVGGISLGIRYKF